MFFMEQAFLTEQEVYHWVNEAANDPAVLQFREEFMDHIINTLSDNKKMKEYIEYGNQFIEANATMLAKPYPTTRVKYPRKYVDNVLSLFGFTTQSAKKVIRDLLRKYIAEKEFFTIVSYPTNVIHICVLVYCDMLTNIPKQIKEDRNNLRDSARQQLGLTIYAASLEYQFHYPHPEEATMAYTYQHLDRSWNLVRCENMINWIGDRVETGYAFYRTKMSLYISPQIVADVLNRIRNSFRQDLRSLGNRYFADSEARNSIGTDITDDDEQYVEKKQLIQIRDNLVRKISGGDSLYAKKGELYKGIANWKNVKIDTLYDFAQKVDKKDIGKIIDLILYVFITKEGNELTDINSSKYIGRITKFPTAIDRAIAGKPVLLPMCEKYEADGNIVKAYICLIATYMLKRINDILQS